MANCHPEFQKFHEKIKLTDKRKEQLLSKAELLKSDILEYLKKECFVGERDHWSAKFHMQGSFACDTVINPNHPEDEYDLDIGLYIAAGTIPSSPNPATIHDWVVRGASKYGRNVVNKNYCVRVPYATADHIPSFHVDVPIFFLSAEGTPHLVLKNDYKKSDPVAFKKWFLARKNLEQLKRVVCYMKDWADVYYGETPKGIIHTILTAKHFVASNRDDVSLLRTLVQMEVALNREFECYRPTTDRNENLFDEYTSARQGKYLGQLHQFARAAAKAVNAKSIEKSLEKWKAVYPYVDFPSTPVKGLRDVSHYVHISAWYSDSKNGKKIDDLKSDDLALRKGRHVCFSIRETSVEPPYEVKWTVENTGEESVNDRTHGGDLSPSSKDIWEHTGYTGRHLMICEVVKDDIVLAMNVFYVNVK